MSTMRASLIIEARDRASAVFGKIAAKSRDMGKAFQPVTREAKQADRAMDGAGRSAQAMAFKMAIAEKAGFAMGRSIRWAGGHVLAMAKWGAVAAVGGIGALAVGVVRVGAKFEQFRAQLEGTEGSAAGAKKALAWVSDFAATTPYEIDQVTDAFVRARNLGIDPYNGALTSLGDAASGTNKTIMEAVEALADAETFQFERLREFGITSASKGNEVSFKFVDRGGKSAMKTVKKDAKEIEKALLAIWDSKYAGGMARQSKTLVGIWSNLKDRATGFLLKIADAGIFDKLKGGLADVLSWVNKVSDDGSMDRWATKISDGLGRMVDHARNFVQNTDWGSVIGALKQIARLAEQVAGLLAQFGEFDRWTKRTDAWVGATFSGRPEDRARYQKQYNQLSRDEVVRDRQSAPGYREQQFRKVRGGRNAVINRPAAGSGTKIGGSVDIRLLVPKGVEAKVARNTSKSKAVPLNVATVQAA